MRRWRVLQETQDREEIVERVAALDIGKAELACCVRVPHEGRRGRRLQEVETYSTKTRSLLGLSDRLACLGVTRVVMEATSDYWKPVFYVLEAAGFETWLVNARDVKHLPGRPKTDKLDCIWLCKVAERQMLRPSFVPPPPVRRLRDVSRYRADLVAGQGAAGVLELFRDGCFKQVVAGRLQRWRRQPAGLVFGEGARDQAEGVLGLPVGEPVRAGLPVRDHAEPPLVVLGQADKRPVDAG